MSKNILWAMRYMTKGRFTQERIKSLMSAEVKELYLKFTSAFENSMPTVCIAPAGIIDESGKFRMTHYSVVDNLTPNKETQMKNYSLIDSTYTKMIPCNCIGPQNGQPVCPCAMRNVKIIDGRYVQIHDLGPVSKGIISDKNSDDNFEDL